ncbi:Acetyltransferase (GNAT) family protein [Micromonospora phaseoli]|uniref:Acetyltransferase (GNAT) family protein n=1 Tax=Micromonospora phaseoli TaxID=1144548 RepID=A0A1H7DHE4_9ACTN|nr:GNAT family N-acetyltransferase [Micromonospora phaseoli]PZW02329.1 acetyltransferase (GNAT) family protein [Micromonospora phaseoli]GIJ75669.1 GNAT family N-acetyltransferase [Micromonospora phaseoli]SEK01219.1 Acetyltransferase (GNAT) family protein [Micromonospora phaseoli]
MAIAVTPYEPADEAALDAAYRIVSAAQAVDLPDVPVGDRAEFGLVAAHPPFGNVIHHALARRDGAAAGYLRMRLPQLENTGNATVELIVDPAHRRHGVGQALLAYARKVAAGHGRIRLIAETVGALPGGPAREAPGAAFAAAAGGQAALAEVRRRLDTTRLDHVALAELHDAARSRAGGYRTVRWRGPVPEEYVADVARLEGRLLTDAPTGDLAIEAENVDAARIREIERFQELRGRRRYHVGAVYEETGRLVAWTMIDRGPSTPWHAWQEITIVDPPHRGHRLGLLVKIENLRFALAHEPELTAIDTWNAAVNDHMIIINEQLGFRPVDAWTDWQLAI